jgi:NTP pyrophosphatase (non-canonical NTP hydrolase)
MEKTKQTTTTPMNDERVFCAGLNEDARQIFEDNKLKGFWDTERETGTLLMLMVSELAEALEADRKNKVANIEKFNNRLKEYEDSPSLVQHLQIADPFKHCFEIFIKDTFEDELADTVIRILDLCGARGVDIMQHINLKLAYNRTRERKHGKAY